MKIINSPVVTNLNVEYDFNEGDLIFSSKGPMWCFKWKKGAKLDKSYTYHIATSAEENYFWKRIYNGYELIGAIDFDDFLYKNFNTFVINHKDI